MSLKLRVTAMDEEKAVRVLYTNYRGETTIRRVLPKSIWFGSCEWYPSEQWLLDVIDLERSVERVFALKNIRAWLGADE